MNRADIEGKVVVVTGAAGRLGGQLVEGFGRAGARVAAVVRSEQAGRRVNVPEGGIVLHADVADEAETQRCFGEVQQRLGRVDVLVHAVGTWNAWPLAETTNRVWEDMMRTNLTSAFVCFREAVRAMSGRPGRLIAFAAGQGADHAVAQQAAYAASKAGVIRLVEATAREYAGQGITAHAIAPSSILYAGEAEGQKGVQASHLVDLCLFLCSDAGAALNGTTLRAYGPH